MKKLFFRVYQNKDSMWSRFFVERSENITKMYGLENSMQYDDCSIDNNIPALVPVFMTEEEFNELPEFQGF